MCYAIAAQKVQVFTWFCDSWPNLKIASPQLSCNPLQTYEHFFAQVEMQKSRLGIQFQQASCKTYTFGAKVSKTPYFSLLSVSLQLCCFGGPPFRGTWIDAESLKTQWFSMVLVGKVRRTQYFSILLDASWEARLIEPRINLVRFRGVLDCSKVLAPRWRFVARISLQTYSEHHRGAFWLRCRNSLENSLGRLIQPFFQDSQALEIALEQHGLCGDAVDSGFEEDRKAISIDYHWCLLRFLSLLSGLCMVQVGSVPDRIWFDSGPEGDRGIAGDWAQIV